MPQYGQIQSIPVGLILPGENDRKNFPIEGEGGIAALALSITESGFRGAIIVEPHPTIPGHYQVIGGERRLRAHWLIALSAFLSQDRSLGERFQNIQADVCVGLSRASVRLIMAQENMARADLDPFETGASFKRMLDEGDFPSVSELCRVMGKTESYVRSRLALLDLIPQAREVMLKAESGFSVSHGAAMKGLDPEYQQAALWRFGKQNMNLAEFKSLCDQLRGKQNSAQADFFALVPLEVVAESIEIERSKSRAQIEKERDEALALIASQRRELAALKEIVKTLGRSLTKSQQRKIAEYYRKASQS